MSYLLDTDWVIDHFTNQPSARGLLAQFLDEGAFLSILSFIELWEGVYRSQRRSQAEDQLHSFLKGPTVLPISRRIALHTAQLRGELRGQGHHIQHRAFDLVVAATAVTLDLTLVTSNTRDYEDIPGLRLLNPRTAS